ncbi:unnamed protein product [Larinioides sclopetarius]|uniref:SSD domain-containing protein n=1 Tax=Larinioides sclopetarius TaxID=280406 RepID=A0AAV2ABZ2_9ARAC
MKNYSHPLMNIAFSAEALCKEDDHCIGYDMSKFDPDIFYVYSGPPKPFDKNIFIGDNITSGQLLQTLCPDFAYDEVPRLCCAVSRLLEFQKFLDLLEVLGFSRCLSCFHNLRQIGCLVTCAPWQGLFSTVTRSVLHDDRGHKVEIMDAVDVHISKSYIYTMFESCKEIQGIFPGTLLLDLICGPWGSSQCTPERLMDSIGAPKSEGGRAPFRTTFLMHIEDKIDVNGRTFYPIKASNFKCSEAPGPNLSTCNCYDCKASCAPKALEPPVFPDEPEPFSIFKIDSLAFCAILGFSLFSTFITVIFCCLNSSCLQSQHSSSTVRSYPEAASLTDLEENQSIKPKDSFTISKTDKEVPFRKPHIRLSMKFGNWLEEKLKSAFLHWSIFVSKKPVTVVILSLLICGIYSLGLVFNFNITTDPVDLWVSHTSEARRDMEDYNKHFGPFYRIEQIIITPTNQESFYHPVVVNHELKNISWGPVFQQDFLLEVFKLQEKIEDLTVAFDDSIISLKDICLSPLKPLNTECAIQSIFGFFQNKIEHFMNKTEYLFHFKRCSLAPITLNCFAPYGGPIDAVALVLGGFEETYDSAEALRSIEDELERGSKSDLLPITISYVIMFLYITFSLGEYHECKTLLVGSKFFLGSIGVLIVLISISSSLGLFGFLGVPSTLIVLEVVPFLVLAVGVDNIFILVQAYQKEEKKPGQSMEQRIGLAVGKVAPRILLSSISMSSCFFIGEKSALKL